jgi:ribonuclease HII
MLDYERIIWNQGIGLVCGVDEAGRGPLAGPVVSAAVVFPKDFYPEGVNDSKKLSASQRERLFDLITENALDFGVGVVDHESIDRINILNASLLSMQKAIRKLKIVPEMVLVDGRIKIPHLKIPQIALVKGDNLSVSVASASILAKVTRDRLMEGFHRKYPQFSFDKNKGYSTKAHREALENYGPCKIHRRSFKLSNLLKRKQPEFGL